MPKNTANTTTLSLQPLIIESAPSAQNIFSCFSSQSWAMWLDSCEDSHIDSQFDIIVWSPEEKITTQGGQTTVTNDQGKVVTTNEDPLLVAEQRQSLLFKDIHVEAMPVPFTGGTVGFFSYDLGRHFEKLPNKSTHDIVMPDMAVGIYLQAIIVNKATSETFLLCKSTEREKIETQIKALLTQKIALPSFSLTSPWQANMNEKEYSEKFSTVQDYLLSGDCYQINLAQRFNANYKGDEFHAYQALRSQNQAPFSAFIRIDEQVILSISPERFLKVEQGKVQSKPIKGTRPRSSDAVIDNQNAQELLNAEKDRAENLMIVDLLRNDISKVCIPATVKVPKLFDIESFPAVHHLVSTVEGKLASNYSAYDLLRGAFPGGSITGAPKIRAMEIIDELEPNRRNVYCGSIGYISHCGNMDTSITIRTLICDQNKIYCWAGGGVVADSMVASEYQETFDKVSKILPILTNTMEHKNIKQ